LKKLLSVITESPILLVAMICIVVPWLTKNPYLTHIILMCVIYAILASSLNIAVGFTGLSNLAHVTFFGVGAFVAAILNTRFHVPFYVTLVAGGLIAGIFGVILGAPTLRLKGVFLAMVTIAFGNAMRLLEINWVSLTNGPMGIGGISPAAIGGLTFNRISYIYYALALLILTMHITRQIMKSKLGRAFFAIKYDETVARSMGVNVTLYKVEAYALSACVAGMAGTIYAHYVAFISPSTFTMADSTTVLCMVVLGGAGSLVGPIAGAAILTIMPAVLRFAELYRIVFIGIVMVVGVIARERNWPNIISDVLKRRMLRFSKRKAVENAEAGGQT